MADPDDGRSRGPTFHINGPAQFNTDSPGSVQTNSAEPRKRTKARKRDWLERLSWIAVIVVAIVAVAEYVRHKDTAPLPARAEAATSLPSSSPTPPPAAPTPTPLPSIPVPSSQRPETTPHKKKANRTMKKADEEKPSLTINGPAQINNNSPNSIQNNYLALARPPRTLTDDSKRALKARLPAGSEVHVFAWNPDTETLKYANMLFAYLLSQDYKMTSPTFGDSVIHYTSTEPFEGQSVEDRNPDGSYSVLIGTQPK